MVDETADELIQNCITATREGADFPTVDNQWFVFDSTSKEFVLRRR